MDRLTRPSKKKALRAFWITKNYGLTYKRYPWNAFESKEDARNDCGAGQRIFHVREVPQAKGEEVKDELRKKADELVENVNEAFAAAVPACAHIDVMIKETIEKALIEVWNEAMDAVLEKASGKGLLQFQKDVQALKLDEKE